MTKKKLIKETIALFLADFKESMAGEEIDKPILDSMDTIILVEKEGLRENVFVISSSLYADQFSFRISMYQSTVFLEIRVPAGYFDSCVGNFNKMASPISKDYARRLHWDLMEYYTDPETPQKELAEKIARIILSEYDDEMFLRLSESTTESYNKAELSKGSNTIIITSDNHPAKLRIWGDNKPIIRYADLTMKRVSDHLREETRTLYKELLEILTFEK